MRNIQKGSAPECIADIDTDITWEEFQGECKDTIATQAFEEQNGLCIYCERQLGASGWRDTAHIEHLRPQAKELSGKLRLCQT